MSEQKKKIMLAAVGGILLLFLFVGGCTAMTKSKPTPTPTPPSSSDTSSSESSSSGESSSNSSMPEENPADDVVIPAALTRGEFAALLASKLNISVSSEAKNVFTDM